MIRIRVVFIFFLCVVLTGCSTVGYYAQSAHGHLALMGQSRPIRQLIVDPATTTDLRAKLRRIEAIRTFTVERLLLPDNESYRSYADIGREAVVWSVVATPEFSVEPEVWCYPVIGCASYRGYFEELRADAFAEDLQTQGRDVAVHPVPAYSTLGWFSDPLPSTVINWPEANLAGLIFHELAHQKVYVKGDSAFNEAFATAVEQIGIERWMRIQNQEAALEAWHTKQQRERAFIRLLLDTRKELKRLYGSEVPAVEMRWEKAKVFRRMKERYGGLRQGWSDFAGYDHWFDRPPNNAYLASVATYEAWVPAFIQLFRQSSESMALFYEACQKLAELPPEERVIQMLQLKQEAGER